MTPGPVPVLLPRPQTIPEVLARFAATGYGMAELQNGPASASRPRSVGQPPLLRSLRARPQVALLFEDQIRQLIRDRFSRGKFNLTITWAGVGEGADSSSSTKASPTAYVAAMETLRGATVSGRIDLRTLAGLPDLFTWGTRRFSDDEAWTLVKEVVEKSCESMNGMKARVRAALAADLTKRLALIKSRARYRSPGARRRATGKPRTA